MCLRLKEVPLLCLLNHKTKYLSHFFHYLPVDQYKLQKQNKRRLFASQMVCNSLWCIVLAYDYFFVFTLL